MKLKVGVEKTFILMEIGKGKTTYAMLRRLRCTKEREDSWV